MELRKKKIIPICKATHKISYRLRLCFFSTIEYIKKVPNADI